MNKVNNPILPGSTKVVQGFVPSILLLENNYMVRHAFSMNAKETGFAYVFQTATVSVASRKCGSIAFHGLIIGLSHGEEELSLIESVRSGHTKCHENVPIVAIVSSCTAEILLKLNNLDVKEIMPRPLRVRTIQDATQHIITMAVSA